MEENVFTYSCNKNNATITFYVNFADEDLFYGYGIGLFAQDEMQAAEHPILGFLRENLLVTYRFEPSSLLIFYN